MKPKNKKGGQKPPTPKDTAKDKPDATANAASNSSIVIMNPPYREVMEKFGDDGAILLDVVKAIVEDAVKESEKRLTAQIRLAGKLMEKSSETETPYHVLGQVFRRGLADWQPGSSLTQEQHAFNRVNSFIAGGKAFDLDEDLLNDKKIEESTMNDPIVNEGAYEKSVALKARAAALLKKADSVSAPSVKAVYRKKAQAILARAQKAAMAAQAPPKKPVKTQKEAFQTPVAVTHPEWGIGRTIPGQARMRLSGMEVDVMFEHGIEKNVKLSSLQIKED